METGLVLEQIAGSVNEIQVLVRIGVWALLYLVGASLLYFALRGKSARNLW